MSTQSMERGELLQYLINTRNFKSYLEIGVLGGYIFFDVRCANKVAVDPTFRFNWKGKYGSVIRNYTNIFAKYFEETSDVFFDTHAPIVYRKRKLDLCLIDGMHEFEYVLRDVNNTLKYLSEDGVIVLHDCNPLSALAGCSFKEWSERQFEGLWNGDVWKCILYLNANRADLDVFVLDCDQGLGVIRKRAKEKLPRLSPLSIEEIKILEYKDFERNRVDFLNLKAVHEMKGLFG